jgi:hypothetical protein
LPHLHLGLTCNLFPSCFKTKILYAFRISPIHAACPNTISSDSLNFYTSKISPTNIHAFHTPVFFISGISNKCVTVYVCIT